ncbi:MAG: cobalamin biosynthesis protein CbiA [Desulfobacterales bacterium]|nr:MAG: cobalamin biosynthesis protein CbiA [Desulfobacterales bacterium]
MPLPDLSGLYIITGNYGSGKTEVSVNMALSGRAAGKEVRIADLDLVNPYFRTREAKSPLRAAGIDVILPDEGWLNADLPILTPRVAGVIRRPSELTILDVGGDDVGATVLAALSAALQQIPPDIPVHIAQVVNPHRPYTDTPEGAIAIGREIETAARIRITGYIGNANLIDETTASVIMDGHRFMTDLARKADLPLLFITVPEPLAAKPDRGDISCPVLPIRRQMTPPWAKGTPPRPADRSRKA